MAAEFEVALERELAMAGNHRRDKVFAVANLYQRHGLPIPGSSEMRSIVGKGSLTDITRDLKDFRAVTTEKVVAVASVPGLPRDLELKMSEVMSGLWQTIYERAESEFTESKLSFEAELQSLSTKLTESEKERLHALEERQIVLGRMAELEKELSATNVILDAERKSVAELTATVAGLQSEIGRLATELLHAKQTADTEKQGLQAALKERENRILDLQTSDARLKAAYEEKISTAHAMEAEHRIRADRAEQGRQVAVNQVEEVREMIAQAQQKNAVLESQLAAERAASADAEKLRQDLVHARAAIEAANARLEAAAREREDHKKELTRARDDAKNSGELAAELRGQLKAAGHA